MFGYVIVNEKSLKDEEVTVYREYYCGLCEALREKYGIVGRVALSFDITFVVMLLSSLYDTDFKEESFRCLARPTKKQKRIVNDYSFYGADMTVLLSYYKCVDDLNDEGSKKGLVAAKLLEKGFKEVEKAYPEKCLKIKTFLDEITAAEKENTENIDLISGLFGHIMEEIVCPKEDEWSGLLRKTGFYLGKFIYIMDAYDDVERDIKNGSYNPFKNKFGKDGFEDYCMGLLNMMMAECAKGFELLPLVDNIEILRNIIYAGVWVKFEIIRAKRKEKNESL